MLVTEVLAAGSWCRDVARSRVEVSLESEQEARLDDFRSRV